MFTSINYVLRKAIEHINVAYEILPHPTLYVYAHNRSVNSTTSAAKAIFGKPWIQYLKKYPLNIYYVY